MKALILNSGTGSRMGKLTSEQPKCMTELLDGETILSRQLNYLKRAGIKDVVITTGLYDQKIKEYCEKMQLKLNYTFVYNPSYKETNYIYSIYIARQFLDDDIILLHGDLVFEYEVLEKVLAFQGSCVVVNSKEALPEKDFKAVLEEDENSQWRVKKVGIEFFEHAVAAQPFYKLQKEAWNIWQKKICLFCESGQVGCYAENALNEVTDTCILHALDIREQICNEVDTVDDLERMRKRLEQNKQKTVYMCFSTDIIHSGHIAIIEEAEKLGSVTIGVLSDEATASYKRYPLLSFDERKNIVSHIKGVDSVIVQNSLSYAENIRLLKPDYIVHGDDWRTGFQQPIRDEVISELAVHGGKLVEYPYSSKEEYAVLDKEARKQLAMPDLRRGRLKNLIQLKGCVTVMEAHSGITGLLVEQTTVLQEGKTYQFDAMWVSSLCDSTAKGKPDIELVDMTSRYRTIDDIMEVTTKPIIFDGDTGGLLEHFVYTVRTLERMGVSMCIIEDKTGLKKNSLFGTEVEQTQDSIENFCQKITAGKKAQKTKDFMIVARIESLILEQGMEDALTRAFAYVKAGADGIMIHSRRKEPDEIFEFVGKFRECDKVTPIVVVPTSFNSVTEEEFKARGVNVIIYANQLTRSAFPAMQKVARTILTNHRAQEADELCMPIKEILTLIPEEF